MVDEISHGGMMRTSSLTAGKRVKNGIAERETRFDKVKKVRIIVGLSWGEVPWHAL